MNTDIATDSEHFDQLAKTLAAHNMPEGWSMVGSSVNARVAVDANTEVFYKEFLKRSPLEALKALVKGSRATRARKNNEALRAENFTAPVNLAWGPLPGGREYLFSSAVPGQGVTTWLRESLTERKGETLKLRRELLSSLGDFIGRMHRAGFTHGDLRTSNVLAQRDENTFQFSLIDNERNQQRLPPAGRDVLRNLMQLNMLLPSDVTNTDRMRVFVQWRNQMPNLNREETKLIAFESWRWAMRRLRAKGKIQ
ncbi:MAG: lipopolysaccharide kinase InaA family protein [Halioglobus sp.]